MTVLLLTLLPWGNSVCQVLCSWLRTELVWGLKWDFKRGLVTQNYIISHPQTEEVGKEKGDSESHFLELHLTPCESKLNKQDEMRSTQADLYAYRGRITPPGHREESNLNGHHCVSSERSWLRKGGFIVYIKGHLFPCGSPKNQTRKCEQTKVVSVLALSEVVCWNMIILARLPFFSQSSLLVSFAFSIHSSMPSSFFPLWRSIQ